MLPIEVPIGSWRFPTDNLQEAAEPQIQNPQIIWGPSIVGNEPGVIPSAYQSSLEAYNNWCRYAYDWDAIFAVLDELHEAQQVAAQGVYYGTHWPVLGRDIPESAGWGTDSIESFSDSDSTVAASSDPIDNTP